MRYRMNNVEIDKQEIRQLEQIIKEAGEKKKQVSERVERFDVDKYLPTPVELTQARYSRSSADGLIKDKDKFNEYLSVIHDMYTESLREVLNKFEEQEVFYKKFAWLRKILQHTSKKEAN